MSKNKRKYNLGGDLGGIAGGLLGTLIPIPGVGNMIGASLGKAAGNWIGNQFNGNREANGVVQPNLITQTNPNQQLTSLNPFGNSIAYALGGDITQYKGPSHEQGGIALGQTDVEVEGNEVKIGNYVFSDRLNIPDKDISFAEMAKTIKNKYSNSEGDTISSDSLNRELAQLAQVQEIAKQKIQSQVQQRQSDTLNAKQVNNQQVNPTTDNGAISELKKFGGVIGDPPKTVEDEREKTGSSPELKAFGGILGDPPGTDTPEGIADQLGGDKKKKLLSFGGINPPIKNNVYQNNIIDNTNQSSLTSNNTIDYNLFGNLTRPQLNVDLNTAAAKMNDNGLYDYNKNGQLYSTNVNGTINSVNPILLNNNNKWYNPPLSNNNKLSNNTDVNSTKSIYDVNNNKLGNIGSNYDVNGKTYNVLGQQIGGTTNNNSNNNNVGHYIDINSRTDFNNDDKTKIGNEYDIKTIDLNSDPNGITKLNGDLSGIPTTINNPVLPNNIIPQKAITDMSGQLQSDNVTNDKNKNGLRLPNINLPKIGGNINGNIGDLGKAALLGAGSMYDIYRGMKGGDYESYGKINSIRLNRLDPSQAIQNTRELGNIAMTKVRNVGGQGLSGFLNNTGAIANNTQKNTGNIMSQYDNANIGIANQEVSANNQIQAQNRQIERLQNDTNAKERDAASNNIQHGLTGLGTVGSQLMQDNAQRKVQDSVIQNLMSTNNYQYTKNQNGDYIMTTEKGKFKIDQKGYVYDDKGNVISTDYKTYFNNNQTT